MKNLMAMMALISTPVFATEYIVKFNNQNFNPKSLKSVQDVRSLNLSYGNFAVVKSENKALINSLAMNPNIEYIEPNFTYKAINNAGPKDKEFEKQWGLNNDGKNSGGLFSRGVEGMDISAIEAWKVTKGASEVKIAVIDTGVDYNHEDLKNNILVNTDELNGLPGVDDDGNGYIDDVYGYDFANDDADPMDGHGHGTHCAGVIGAEHNGIGIAGIMANVKILPIKFLTDSGSGSLEGALKSIDYATQRGVQIMSNSWGGGGRSQALYEAIERAQNSGITFIAAAGNESNNNDTKPSYPASYQLDNVISVGAMDGKGKKASFSNYGRSSVHVFAPGVKILSTVQNDKYKKMSGTSMACPHVAGIAGLLVANEPNLTYAEIKAKIMSTAIPSKELSPYTASGYVDAHRALTK